MLSRTLKIAMRAIVSNKIRSFLTMLGIIIGVMAVVILVSIGQGAQQNITASISSMGSTLLTASITDEDVNLTTEDLDELSNYSTIDAVAPVVSTTLTVKSGSTTTSSSIVGITPSYYDVYGVDVQSGRKIVKSDLDWRTPICVIGTDVATEIFETWDVVGEKLTVGSNVYTIVGLLEESGSSTFGSNDNVVLIPLTSAERLTGETSITQFYVTADSSSDVTRCQNIVESYLLNFTRDEDAYSVYNESEVLETMSDVTDTLSLMLGGIAAISLLVGGIGIMNIMLVSVIERTQEIGIRKAVGAKRRNIMWQFLIEACVLSVLGGLIGIVLSLLGIQIYNIIAQTSITMSYGIAFAALAFCAIIGILFGCYPAAKASRLMPIDALRHT
ncbi:MAG: ABC transporter permease [Eubacteriales bacterium]